MSNLQKVTKNTTSKKFKITAHKVSMGAHASIWQKVIQIGKRILEESRNEASGIFEAVIRSLPNTYLSRRIRHAYYEKRCKFCGESVEIYENVLIYGPQNLEIGFSITIAANCILSAHGGLKIGNFVFVGPGTYIWTRNHDYLVNNIKKQERYICKPVAIGSNVWIGAGVRIVPGVTIGDGSVVAMGAVVTKNVPTNVLVAGNPAKIIKEIKRI